MYFNRNCSFIFTQRSITVTTIIIPIACSSTLVRYWVLLWKIDISCLVKILKPVKLRTTLISYLWDKIQDKHMLSWFSIIKSYLFHFPDLAAFLKRFAFSQGKINYVHKHWFCPISWGQVSLKIDQFFMIVNVEKLIVASVPRSYLALSDWN